MSKNIKGLEFSSNEPAFLRRMRGEISGNVDDPDRHVNAVVRPQRPKRLDAEEDEGPTYVMEDSTTISKKEYEALVKGDEAKEAEDAKDVTSDGNIETSEKAGHVAGEAKKINGLKKRKAIKVIGANEEDDPKDSVLGKAIGKIKGNGKVDGKIAPKKKKAKVNIKFDDGDET